MTIAEYILADVYCHIRCEPEKEKCKYCEKLKVYKEIYGDKEYEPRRETIFAKRPIFKVIL
jgi:hypothetical protein